MFGHEWQCAQGKIIESRVRSVSGDGLVVIREYIVDVTMPGGGLLRALVEEPRIATDFRQPARGDEVGVEVDAKNQHVRFDKTDPRLSIIAHRQAEDEEFAAMLAQEPGTPVAGAAPDHELTIFAVDPTTEEGQQITELIRRMTTQRTPS